MTNYGIAFLNLPGGNELLWIFLIVLLLFGASALPKLFRSFGKSVREFKKAQDGLYDEMDKAASKDDTSADKQDDADTAKKKPDAKPDE